SWSAHRLQDSARSRKLLWLTATAAAVIAGVLALGFLLRRGKEPEAPPDTGGPPPRKKEDVRPGYYTRTQVIDGVERPAPPLAFRPDPALGEKGRVFENGRVVGAWENAGDEVRVAFSGKQQGKLLLKRESPLRLSGTQILPKAPEQLC